MPTARQRWSAILLCTGLILSFTFLAWTAVQGKSFTPDESGGTLDGWFMLYQHDFRFSDLVPPLFGDWIVLPGDDGAIPFDRQSPQYRPVWPHVQPPYWSHRVPLWLMWRARVMCLILGVALALLIARWAWELGGTIPCIAATFLYCLDPNFLGHAALAKNDVPCALFYAATAYAAWKAGKRLTWASAACVAVLTALTTMFKFSGAMLGPVLFVLFLFRALNRQPWMIGRRLEAHRTRKLAFAASIGLLTILVTYSGIWASYGFRFESGPNGLNATSQRPMTALAFFDLQRQLHRDPRVSEMAAWRPGFSTRMILAAEQHYLIPEALVAGLLNTQIFDLGLMNTYLLGRIYTGGNWTYFPLAFLFKEPLATIAAIGLAMVAALRTKSFFSWSAICLTVPAAIYFLTAMDSQFNIGFRHLFPALPMVFIATGLAIGRLWASRRLRLLILLLAAALAVETSFAFPNFIAFFNVACASDRSYFLADSNLDWGQDLPALADWQHNHPGITIYLDFFGHNIPEAYGVKSIDISQGDVAHPQSPSVAAVSLTLIQLGQFNQAALRSLGVDPYSQPEAILNDTIYLFRTHP